MKKVLVCFTGIMMIWSCAMAQDDVQTAILTDIGIITVSKTMKGKDMIIMNAGCWDKLVSGTKYAYSSLSFYHSKKLLIEIANKKNGYCRKGIGFGCSIYDCPRFPGVLYNRVDNEHRICAISVIKMNDAVKIIFEDKVDWENLENN